MDVQGRLSKGESVSSFLMLLAGGCLAFPPRAHAIEVGCFCTFVFVSTMFLIGIGVTLVVKQAISRKIWKLSWKRTSLITFLEVVLLITVLIVLQTQFYIRVFAYLPLAFLLNYALTTAKHPAPQEQRTPRKRLTMAALSCLALPVAVQVMGWLATVLSNMITFKEVRV
jgi:Ca2+/Na+ antiporter